MNGRLRLLVALLLLPPPCFANSWHTLCGIWCQQEASKYSSPEVAFSPHGGAAELVVKTIGDARKSIRVAAYGFTSKPIAVALLDARKRGVDVKVVAFSESLSAEKYVIPVARRK